MGEGGVGQNVLKHILLLEFLKPNANLHVILDFW